MLSQMDMYPLLLTFLMQINFSQQIFQNNLIYKFH
jgi:hypothetical protein